MRSIPPASRMGGYALIELALILILLAIFALMANKLFMRCVVIQREARRAGDSIVQIESVIRRLRSDVWSAADLQTDHPDQLAIEMSDGTLIDWQLNVFLAEDESESQAYLVRTESRHGVTISDGSFYALPQMSFRREGPNLYLSDGEDAVRMTMMSGLLQGDRP